MTDAVDRRWELRLARVAAAFAYPATPDFAARLPARPRPPAARMAWAYAALAVALVIAGVMAVPSARAAVLEILRVGAIRLILEPPTPTPAHMGQATPTLAVPLGRFRTVTFDAALQTWPRPILLPAHPPDLGPPDRVYLAQGYEPEALLLVWTDEADPARPVLALYQIEGGLFSVKEVEEVTRTTVDGREAFWVSSPHTIYFPGGQMPSAPQISLNALIWAEAGVTYRLEGDLTMDEAMRIAESLD
jgi:hypothetical protein